jgi:hypothetical protein
VSGSGSRMGAAAIWQMRPDAVIVALSMPLTCGNVIELLFRRLERSVRDEEAAESNPATPTRSEATCGHRRWPLFVGE